LPQRAQHRHDDTRFPVAVSSTSMYRPRHGIGSASLCDPDAASSAPVRSLARMTWVTLALVIATVALVIVTRQGTERAWADARAEVDLLQRQFGAGHRPLLVDVLTTASPPDDMGALYGITTQPTPNNYVDHPGPVIETEFPGHEPTFFDPRIIFVQFQSALIYISVPLRNVGRGLAVIDGDGVEIEGPGIAHREDLAIQREHVPVGETTRVNLILRYVRDDTIGRDTRWLLSVPCVDFGGQQQSVMKMEIANRGDDVQGPWVARRVRQESVETPSTAIEPSGWTDRVRRLLYGSWSVGH
jgi:hypothetical protein